MILALLTLRGADTAPTTRSHSTRPRGKSLNTNQESQHTTHSLKIPPPVPLTTRTHQPSFWAVKARTERSVSNSQKTYFTHLTTTRRSSLIASAKQLVMEARLWVAQQLTTILPTKTNQIRAMKPTLRWTRLSTLVPTPDQGELLSAKSTWMRRVWTFLLSVNLAVLPNSQNHLSPSPCGTLVLLALFHLQRPRHYQKSRKLIALTMDWVHCLSMTTSPHLLPTFTNSALKCAKTLWCMENANMATR